MNHVVAYFGPKECLSKQKHYLRYKMEKPRKLTTRQYVGLVRDLNASMAQMPPSFTRISNLTSLNWFSLLLTNHQEATRLCSSLKVSIQRPEI